MRSRRKLMGTVGTIAAMSIGGCLEGGSNIEGSGGSDNGGNTGSADEDGNTEKSVQADRLRSSYIESLDYNTIATDNLQQTLDEIENGNLETAKTHRTQAFKSFRNGMATYGSTATNQAMKLFDVDSEDDLPEVHQKAVEANKKGHRLVLDMVDNLKPTDGEKPSSDRVDEIRTALEEGEYTVPPLEEFEQALP